MVRAASLALVLALVASPLAPVRASAGSWWPFSLSEHSSEEVPSSNGGRSVSPVLGAIANKQHQQAQANATAKSKVVSVKLQSELQENQA
eukprot:CAMPEP_0171187978 /NCGR_PEP_ID=MMETSP0790-20130122/17596_1 /TAXON_ID=2925 /ORGANISM="Alexandrium catenella, Strain OF101" /LENGTH=89 /DNA_ID=CAMNT_0011653049 /DNA_START=81 /DNA_END=346 /DNA_ORIENTATION=+